MADIRSPPPGYIRDVDRYIITYVYIVFGSIALILNIPLAVYLLKTTSRNQKELIVIIVLSLSDIVCATQFVCMGIYRFIIWFDDVHFISQAACNLNIFVATYHMCIQMDNLFSLVIALDRLFAVLFPVRYNKCGIGYTVLLVTSPIIGAVLGYTTHLIVISVLPPTYMDEICFNFFTVLPAYRTYLAFQRMLCVFIPTLIYINIYIRMRLKFQKIGNSDSVLSKGMKHLTKTVAYLTMASLFLVFIPEVWWYFNLFGGLDASFYFMFILLKKIASFFIHTIRHRELMKHIEKYLPQKIAILIHFDHQSHSTTSKVKTKFSQQMTITMR